MGALRKATHGRQQGKAAADPRELPGETGAHWQYRRIPARAHGEETVPLSAKGIDMPGKAAELVLLFLKLQAGNPSIMRVLQAAGLQTLRVLEEIDQ